jgi:hypothetical protein
MLLDSSRPVPVSRGAVLSANRSVGYSDSFGCAGVMSRPKMAKRMVPASPKPKAVRKLACGEMFQRKALPNAASDLQPGGSSRDSTDLELVLKVVREPLHRLLLFFGSGPGSNSRLMKPAILPGSRRLSSSSISTDRDRFSASSAKTPCNSRPVSCPDSS